MAKQKSYQVKTKTTGGNRKVGVITVEQQRTMQRAASRQAQIDSGIRVGSGAGVHGGNKEQCNRRDRREGKASIRKMED